MKSIPLILFDIAVSFTLSPHTSSHNTQHTSTTKARKTFQNRDSVRGPLVPGHTRSHPHPFDLPVRPWDRHTPDGIAIGITDPKTAVHDTDAREVDHGIAPPPNPPPSYPRIEPHGRLVTAENVEIGKRLEPQESRDQMMERGLRMRPRPWRRRDPILRSRASLWRTLMCSMGWLSSIVSLRKRANPKDDGGSMCLKEKRLCPSFIYIDSPLFSWARIGKSSICPLIIHRVVDNMRFYSIGW